MTGNEIRVHLKAKLVREASHIETAVLVDELGVWHGKGRVDLAVVDGFLNGFEIKGSRDSLIRLERQVVIYNAVFDTVTLVLSTKHVDRALAIVPGWWGLTLAIPDGQSSVLFEPLRDAQRNLHVDHVAQAKLLWRQEALEVLFGLGNPRSVARRPRRELYKILASSLEPAQLRATIRVCLGSRTGWRSA